MSPQDKLKKVSVIICFILLLFLYGFFLCHKINLVTADLGRHLKNGEVIFQNKKILDTNFYSYTEPDFQTINHHWGSGLIFYLIWKIRGFTGLSLFYILLSLSTFLIFFNLSQKINRLLTPLISLLIILLLAQRTEIRPEGFSYFFCAIFLWLLLKYKEERLSFKWLLALPILEILWVNLHIYFFLGPLLILAFLIEKLITSRRLSAVKQLTMALIFVILVTFFNPFGLAGTTAPLTIFNNYGYRVLENQSVWFIEKLIPNPIYFVFKFNFAILTISFLLVLIYQKKNFPLANFFLSLIFSTMAWLSIRNFTLFGFFALPLMVGNFNSILKNKLENYTNLLSTFIPIILFTSLFITIVGQFPLRFPISNWHEFGLGLETGNSGSAEFFKAQKIQGPIFNDYDIGSYLIFHLYPQKVFVDNRPEAYSVDFFEKIYIPMQDEEEEWQKQDEIYNFNAIFFAYKDPTPWAQKFLIRRIKDPSWVPVFVDQYALILLKRNKQNQKIIEEYEIAKERFKVINTP